MRPLSVTLLAAVVLALAAPTAATAASARAAPRCPQGTTALGPRRAPTACVPRGRPSLPASLQAGFAIGRPLPRGALRSSARLRRTAQRALAYARARAGTAAVQRPRARAADSVAGLGEVVAQSGRPDGDSSVRFRQDDGTEVTVRGRRENDALAFEAEVRDRRGAGLTFGFGDGPPAPRCPTAAGAVPATYTSAGVAGVATTSHGKRTWKRVELRVEGGWDGTVGVGARAERFDLDVRGTLEVRSGVEIAATGKVLRRDATRVYRTVLRKSRLPLGTSGRSLLRDVAYFGPKGRQLGLADVELLGSVVAETIYAADSATEDLRKGDVRWYDQRACARIDWDAAPERVAKGGSGTWKLTATAADRAVVSDARWSAASSCGTLAPATASGAAATFTVTDAARGWGPQPWAPACIAAEATTPAGRAPAFAGEIPPEERKRLQVGITVRFHMNMGPGITETAMRGSGEVLLPDTAGVYADGSGTYNGTEWAQTPLNSCGGDMLATRDFAGSAAVGAQRNDDGTITVGFSAVERPFDMAWIVVVPATGGSQRIEARKPFCGEPGRAQTLSDVTVTVRELPAG